MNNYGQLATCRSVFLQGQKWCVHTASQAMSMHTAEGKEGERD